MFFEICGWIGCFLLAVCGLPETWAAFKNKRTGLTWGLIVMWFFGEILAMTYIWGTTANLPVLLNYAFNISLLLPVIWYKFKPGSKTNEPNCEWYVYPCNKEILCHHSQVQKTKKK
jgi:uncharacterized protein with PQ loop repeat